MISSFFIIFSCSDDDNGERNHLGGKPALTGFRSTTMDFPINEESDPVNDQIKVIVDASNQTGSDRNIEVSVNEEKSNAPLNTYTIVNTNIPANSFNGSVDIDLNLDNIMDGESYVLVLDLVSISGDHTINSEKEEITVTFFKVCPIDNFTLDYIVEVFAFGSSYPTHEQTLTVKSALLNQYHMDSSWGPNFVAAATGNNSYQGQYVYSGDLQINCDNTVSFVGDDSWATGGSGTYNPSTGLIKFTVGQELFTDSFTVDVTMNPN